MKLSELSIEELYVVVKHLGSLVGTIGSKKEFKGTDFKINDSYEKAFSELNRRMLYIDFSS